MSKTKYHICLIIFGDQCDILDKQHYINMRISVSDQHGSITSACTIRLPYHEVTIQHEGVLKYYSINRKRMVMVVMDAPSIIV